MTQADWNPESYALFSDLRLRPALDLLARVGALPEGPVVDLGCGPGAVGPALAARFPGRPVVGVDRSPAMLEAAQAAGGYTRFVAQDLTEWQPDAPPALIFSNAALQWLPNHEDLMPRLAAGLAPGGTLAVQMPRQWGAPSHRFLRDIAASLFPERFEAQQPSPVASARRYWELLAGLGEVTAWETDYVQKISGLGEGHPVRSFTQSTAMRPYLDRLTPAEAQKFTAAYDAALEAAYPLLADGAALMPFRRVFFTVVV
ncbi:MAG: methyltransferase domain-containing protein [Pseudorhodobacter sp.]|nr:methyltransferase domain-containing protein [Pseudorhodobacter sp.]